MTDEEIDEIANSMEGGLDGFLKQWGWRQFARAILEAQARKMQERLRERIANALLN